MLSITFKRELYCVSRVSLLSGTGGGRWIGGQAGAQLSELDAVRESASAMAISFDGDTKSSATERKPERANERTKRNWSDQLARDLPTEAGQVSLAGSLACMPPRRHLISSRADLDVEPLPPPLLDSLLALRVGIIMNGRQTCRMV